MRITVKNLQKKIPVNPKRIKKAILKVFRKEGAKLSGEITVSFTSDKKIKALNLKYLRKNNPTDVLAFDLAGPGKRSHFLADIIISADAARRNARIFKTTPRYELDLYAVHGALHLLGYNDHTERQKQLMRRKEEEYVSREN